MAGQFEIRLFQTSDYDQVCRIFQCGVLGAMGPLRQQLFTIFTQGNPIQRPMQLFCFAIGYSATGSLAYGMVALATYCLLALAFMYLVQHEYLWISMATDMKDKELKFWTKQPGNCFLVASLSSHPDKVVGCVAYKSLGSDTVEVNRMSVAKDFRGLGVGRKLMETVLEQAKQGGYSRVYLTTSNGQETAIKLYRKMGFIEIGRVGLEQPISKYLVPINGLQVFEFLYKLE